MAGAVIEADATDPKIRHRFYKNGMDLSTITNDINPEHLHIVAQYRATWKSTMLIETPTSLQKNECN